MENIYNLKNEYGIMTINSPKFGIFEIQFDLEDYDFLKSKQWCISKCADTRIIGYYAFYAVCKDGLLHRLLMNTPKGFETDHIDGDSLNNRKYNLRVCTRLENARNRKLNKDNTTGHKGVLWYTHRKYPSWMAYIQIDNKFINLGYFDIFEDAVKARLEAEEKYFGEYKRDIDNL